MEKRNGAELFGDDTVWFSFRHEEIKVCVSVIH